MKPAPPEKPDFILLELGRGTYAEALSRLSALAVTNRVTVVTDDVQVNFFGGEALYTKPVVGEWFLSVLIILR